MTKRLTAWPPSTETRYPRITPSPTCGDDPGPARTAENPIAWMSATSSLAIRPPSSPPVAICSAVCGLRGALTLPPIEESAGMPLDDATKSYTQIRLGRVIASLTIGVCWVTSVEAHPVTTAKANKNAALQLRDFIAGLLLLAH